MVIVQDSAPSLKRFLAKTFLGDLAKTMVFRMVIAFTQHQGRMSCSQAAHCVASESIHRGELTRFLARPRWQKDNFNTPLREALLKRESRRGKFLFLIDATLVSQSGRLTKNCFSTGNKGRHPAKGRRYNRKKVIYKKCHSFTFGLLITPTGIRLPFEIPHYTKEYCKEHGLQHRTTAEAASDMLASLPLPDDAEVIVLGDTAYDAQVVRDACDKRGYTWIVPANPERVYEGPTGHRPKLRSRLKDWKSLSLKTIKLRASTGKYAKYRRLSKWRVGLKLKPRAYYAYQEKREVRSMGYVRLVFSTMKSDLKKATPDDVKILLTNDTTMSLTDVIELYSLRWQIELFFKELKSTLGFSHYSFQDFNSVRAWVEIAITTVLFLEHERAKRLQDRRLTKERKRWWEAQRLHGLCIAFQQECETRELKNIEKRLKTPGGISKLKRLLNAARPTEYRAYA